jgi:hypothetical protein
MNLHDALAELGAQVGLPELTLNEEGTCRVVFDDQLAVTFESVEDGRFLHLSAVVLTAEEVESQPGHLETLLHANVLGIATGGAYFSLEEGTGEVLLERALEMAACDGVAFMSAVESFVNHLEAWKAQLASNTIAPAFGDATGTMLPV